MDHRCDVLVQLNPPFLYCAWQLYKGYAKLNNNRVQLRFEVLPPTKKMHFFVSTYNHQDVSLIPESALRFIGNIKSIPTKVIYLS